MSFLRRPNNLAFVSKIPPLQAYMDLLAFERKLDATIMRKRLDIQEALKRPQKIKRKLRIFISHTFFPGRAGEPIAYSSIHVDALKKAFTTHVC